ncbi:MAG: aminotransferase class IV [Deltaproteobacteria bacterium]
MSEQVFIDGERAESLLPLRTLFYGEGVFETFRYKSRLPVFFPVHYQRMKRGAELLRIPIPEISGLSMQVRNAVEEAGYSDAYVKVCLLSQGSSRFYDNPEKEAILVIIKEYSATKEPVKTLVHPVKRYSESPLLRIKSMNYLENIAARREAIEKGFDEALFLNHRDEITEGSASNVFWFKDGVIFTPSLECGLLPGITRDILLNNIPELGIEVREGRYFPSDIIDSDFAFFTNSITGCSLISRINDCNISVDQRRYGDLKELLIEKLKWS